MSNKMLIMQFASYLTFLFVIHVCTVTSLSNNGHIEKFHSGLKKNFIFFSNSIIDKPCDCKEISCSCCENVIIIFFKLSRRLCANFNYQRNGLNVDVSLNGRAVRSTTVTNYQPFRICTLIPGSIFSSACVNVIQLTLTPQSITACIRMDITSKHKEWKINYSCMSISTTLPMINAENAGQGNGTIAIPEKIKIQNQMVSTLGPTVGSSMMTSKNATEAVAEKLTTIAMEKPISSTVTTMPSSTPPSTTRRRITFKPRPSKPSIKTTTGKPQDSDNTEPELDYNTEDDESNSTLVTDVDFLNMTQSTSNPDDREVMIVFQG